MTKEELIEILNLSENKQIPEKYAAIELGYSPFILRYYKLKYGIKTNPIGKAKFTYREPMKYNVNDDFFEKKNLLNTFYAGFIAADGNISNDKKTLSIGLALKDGSILKNFKTDVKFDGVIRNGIIHGKYEYCAIAIRSTKICDDLERNFNITSRKSLTLKPPNLENINLIDSFICGYIDGDGTIGIYKRNKNCNFFKISMIGTFEVLSWIKKRFEEIIGKDTQNLVKKTDKNTYTYALSNNNARIIFKHYYLINVPKLERKWSEKYYDYCVKYVKQTNKSKRKGVNVFDLNGNLIKKCKTLLEASIFTKVNLHQISYLCKKDSNRYRGKNFMFSRTKTEMEAYIPLPTTTNNTYYKGEIDMETEEKL